jgi:outer membrane protein, multidrug efflux system
LRLLGKEQRSVEIASTAAQKVLGISLTLYRDGATNYLDVVTAQTAALDAERTVIALRTRRVEADVGLMVALGGGFVAETTPAKDRAVETAATENTPK